MMETIFKRKLREAEEHIMPYIKEQKCLKEMCKRCDRYCGKDHDYRECKDMWCYKFYLSYVYLDWVSSYEGR